MNAKKVLLEAPILTQSGYGEHSRLVFESIKTQAGLEFYICPLMWGTTPWITDLDPEIEAGIKRFHEYSSFCKGNNTQPEYDAQIHVGIPNEFEKKAKYSIMVTAGIETDRVSWPWILKTHQGIDKVIVPSQHSRNVYGGTTYEVTNQQTNTKSEIGCGCPIEVVPYPVKKTKSADINLDFETDFNFLNIGLFGPRKNIEQCVLWFIKEFKNDPNAGLILKTGFSKGTQLDRKNTLDAIKKIIGTDPNRKCKIYLLHGNMSEEEMHALYIHPKIKALVTTTHGEGFGLPIFEAVYSGMPVVATDWSAHLDFLEGKVKKNGKEKNKKLFAKVDYKLKEIDTSAIWDDILVEGSKWAYPEEVSFRKQISKVKSNYGMYKKWARILQEQVLKSHEYNKILEQMRTSLGIESPQENDQDVLNEIDALFSSLPED
jgi:glycosyltransferase involved in cell wall biosynthesis